MVSCCCCCCSSPTTTLTPLLTSPPKTRLRCHLVMLESKKPGCMRTCEYASTS